MGPQVGILGVGAFLPPDVRRNEWWPAETLARWRARPTPPPIIGELTPAAARVRDEMKLQAYDPFQGVVERRVLAEQMSVTEMEAAAVEQALAKAGRRASEVDLLLAHTAVPDYLMSNLAAVLHHRLGLPAACLTLQTDASAYSFLAQLTLAHDLVASGRSKLALLVQSAAGSRLLDREDGFSPVFGDAATAVVVGPVASGGILSASHRTDGRYPRTMIAAVRGGRWYDDGRSVLHSADPLGAREVFLGTIDCGIEVIGDALRTAGHRPEEVGFFGVHQGTAWLRKLTQEATGLAAARYHDAFPTLGYLFAASIPVVLALAEQNGQLRARDLVVLFGGGTGATYGATVMRWGDGG